MALNRVNGADELYVGGIFGLNRARLIQEHKITHILSVIKYSLDRGDDALGNIQHLSIDIDDMEDQDLIVHLPKMVRFIDAGLHGRSETASQSLPSLDPSDHPSTGAVLVHCAMGKSRSVSAIIAYLLWKYPHRFGKSNPSTTGQDAVTQALRLVRQTRPLAEPNEGFTSQLEMWWEMGCPADSDDAVEKEPAYQRWLYKREVEDAARVGRAPDWIRFEDEETQKDGAKVGGPDDEEGAAELRCKKCRRMLATDSFIVPHRGRATTERSDCGHFFIEALSWMRTTLEEGVLEGRLICPHAKCAASIGRYAWQGFKCNCGDWVAPAFSLQKSKVDKVVTIPKQSGGPKAIADRMAALGIRMPPAALAPPSVAVSGVDRVKCKENL
ncbi:dual specificity protein phosphatase 12 [Trichocladium antarcticum]|uniref:protein-tyrosine-phosphatase n=1 Tax=Trichocladium antarcticum TaxID=1450529 RepID=A0AAN6UFV4_9PEZI|nr:dual specificity protein phosphatase 12 [Trichocladium antarcticum]